MKTILKSLFTICTLLLLCSTCKQDKMPAVCTDANTLKIPQEIKDRFWFKDSSYWIYKDSISGDIDSSWISESFIGTENNITEKINPFSKGKCFESGLYKVNSNYQVVYKSGINPAITDKNTTFENEFFKIIFFKTNSFSRVRFKGLILDTFNFYDGIVVKLDKIKIQNIDYQDIIYLYYASQGFDIFKRIYYANKIGIIKYEDEDGRVWELINYKVKQ